MVEFPKKLDSGPSGKGSRTESFSRLERVTAHVGDLSISFPDPRILPEVGEKHAEMLKTSGREDKMGDCIQDYKNLAEKLTRVHGLLQTISAFHRSGVAAGAEEGKNRLLPALYEADQLAEQIVSEYGSTYVDIRIAGLPPREISPVDRTI